MSELKTIWGEALDPNAVLQEYPRPQMVRAKFGSRKIFKG